MSEYTIEFWRRDGMMHDFTGEAENARDFLDCYLDEGEPFNYHWYSVYDDQGNDLTESLMRDGTE